MLEMYMYIRAVLLFCFRRGLTPEECRNQVVESKHDKIPPIVTIRRWFRKFRDGDTSLEDKPRPGRPSTVVTDKNLMLARQLINENPRSTYRMIAHKMGIALAAAFDIVHNHLKFTKRFARWVPHQLSDDQKRERVSWCRIMCRVFDGGHSKRVFDIVTGDETWAYYFDPLTKMQSRVWV